MSYNKFVKDLDKLLKFHEENPEDVDGALSLGKYYFINKMYESAVNVYKKALMKRPVPALYYNLGVAYHAIGEHGKAKEMFREALELDPTYAEAAKSLEQITDF